MARLKEVKRGLAMLVLDFDKQLEPGSFEDALCHMVDQGRAESCLGSVDTPTQHQKFHMVIARN